MFNIGDLITGNDRNCYGITNEFSLCVVSRIYSGGGIEVKIVGYGDTYELGHTYDVDPTVFRLTTFEEFYAEHPDYKYDYDKLNKIKKENTTMETKMDKSVTYTLTTEERETLRAEIIDLLTEYGYHPTEEGVDTILDEWVKNKGWMIELFKKHPNYNGKYQITFDADFNRAINSDVLYRFGEMIQSYAKTLKKETVIGGFSLDETRDIYERMSDTYEKIRRLTYNNHVITIDGMSFENYIAECNRWSRKYSLYLEKRDREEIVINNGTAYTKESWAEYKNFYNVGTKVIEYKDHIVSEELATFVNTIYPTVKAKAGQKMSRLVNKICSLVGFDKHPDYNREFAKYSDAINPLAIKRHTILSCHPVDYYTMSFGNSWASCHTIDKTNRRSGENNYHGCYSAGTESYMLDSSSFVFYTVDKDYNGDHYEPQDKINRNMFHIGEDKVVQGRVYPQATDGASNIYKQIREIVQKVISDCLSVPNMWKNIKGTSECSKVINSTGVHYKDYLNFADCNVSYLKENEDIFNKVPIYVGHMPICPNCGCEHEEEETIECSDCYNDELCCYECGGHHSRDRMHEIDGDWYCDDCCFYCNYHDEYETGDSTYVENYGRVCDYAIENGDFYSCEHCGEWHHEDDMIHTEDGTWFCSDSCAERDGYVEIDDYWYPESETYYCEHCGCTVHQDDWNSELDCCTDCEDEVRAELETEESEEN